MENKTLAIQLFEQWDAALATGIPDKVADLYAADAVLLPTLAAEIRNDRQSILDYFNVFLQHNPRGRVTESHVLVDQDLLVHSGLYTFSCGGPDESAKIDIRARFTFFYRHDGINWKIAVHHSSLQPDSLQAG